MVKYSEEGGGNIRGPLNHKTLRDKITVGKKPREISGLKPTNSNYQNSGESIWKKHFLFDGLGQESVVQKGRKIA